MVCCIKCNSFIDFIDQVYFTTDLGPDLLSFIDEQLDPQVRRVLCQQCFDIVTLSMYSMSKEDKDCDPKRCIASVIQHSHYSAVCGVQCCQDSSTPDSQQGRVGTAGVKKCCRNGNVVSQQRSGDNVGVIQQQYDKNNSYCCVLCLSSLKHAHGLPEGGDRNVKIITLERRKLPETPREAFIRVCNACWAITQDAIKQNGVATTPGVELLPCVCCHQSFVSKRGRTIPDGPERDLTAANIFPRTVLESALVCFSCWFSRKKAVGSFATIDNKRATQRPDNLQRDAVCALCGRSKQPMPTHIPSGPERDAVAAMINPNKLPENALLCLDCKAHTQEYLQKEQKVVRQSDVQLTSSVMSLDDFTHTSRTGRCFVPGCKNVERNRIPEYTRKIILKSRQIFVTENARVCNEHRLCQNWDFLERHQFSKRFLKNEIESMLKLGVQNDDSNELDFENLDSINEDRFEPTTGVTKEKFMHIFHKIRPGLNCEFQKTALGIYLVKSRTRCSVQRLSVRLNLNPYEVKRLLIKAKQAVIDFLLLPLKSELNHPFTIEDINKILLPHDG